MKPIKLALLIMALLPAKLYAAATDSLVKQHFYTAKEHIEDMLSGKAPLSYERAIYEIENAWWEGSIHYASFKRTIDFHAMNISNIAQLFRDSMRLHPQPDLSGTAEQKKTNYQQALNNYAIFKYLTKDSKIIGDDYFIRNNSFSYSHQDPLGTKDWIHTQVTHLLINHQGNCYALASLFKILSDRLNSNARLCTAPGHIYIRHADDKGTFYNVELSSRTFPGTGTIKTLTYTADDAIRNGISLRELDLRQSIALCLVYLAKGYEYKFGIKNDDFSLSCAELALQHDDHNLSAMLLKAEVLENRIINQNKKIANLQTQKEFQNYQQWVGHIFQLGYHEMPFEMKNILIKGWTKDTLIQLANADHTPKQTNNPNIATSQASLSWGLFNEAIRTKRLERYGNTVFDTKTQKIVAFFQEDILYNQYNFDPVIFAWNIDPLANKFPWQSPYAVFDNNPIWKNDPPGAAADPSTDVKENSNGSYTVTGAKNDGDNNIYKVDSKGNRTGEVVGQTLQPYDFMYTDDATGQFINDPNYGGRGPVTFDMNNLGVSGTVHPNEYTTATINNANLAELTGWGKGLFNQEVQRQSPATFYGELEILRSMSANGAPLDFKESLGLHAYTPVQVGGDGSTTITTLRAAGNLTFGANMFQTKPALFGSSWYYKQVMPEVGKYNQSHNGGNGYNKGFPYFGEHTYSGSYIYWGYFGKKP